MGLEGQEASTPHPNAQQWKTFDINHLEFASDPRNLRHALSSNGMNTLGETRNLHITWPMMLCVYNIPLWLCYKRKYLMLINFISSLKQIGIDIKSFYNLWWETHEETMERKDLCVSRMHTNKRA
jgi:hypothetical protein